MKEELSPETTPDAKQASSAVETVVMQPPKPIPISEGERIAKEFGYEQVFIFARRTGENGIEHMTTYGINKQHCDIAAKIGNFLKYKIMGWVK